MMPIELKILLAILIALVAGIAIGRLSETVSHLRKQVADLEQRLLEGGPKRLPYQAIETVEDLTAALVKVKQEIAFKDSLIDNALGHVEKLRNTGQSAQK